MTLDAMEAARPGEGVRRPRHQIAHLELITPADVPRFRALGVVANFQPLWAFADSYIRDLTWPALGPERSRYLYPIGSVARSGAVLAFGSDWSVSSLNPLEGIQVAVSRQGLCGRGRAAPPARGGDRRAHRRWPPTPSAPPTRSTGRPRSARSRWARRPTWWSCPRTSSAPGPARSRRSKVLLTLFAGRPVWRDPGLRLLTGGLRASPVRTYRRPRSGRRWAPSFEQEVSILRVVLGHLNVVTGKPLDRGHAFPERQGDEVGDGALRPLEDVDADVARHRAIVRDGPRVQELAVSRGLRRRRRVRATFAPPSRPPHAASALAPLHRSAVDQGGMPSIDEGAPHEEGRGNEGSQEDRGRGEDEAAKAMAPHPRMLEGPDVRGDGKKRGDLKAAGTRQCR